MIVCMHLYVLMALEYNIYIGDNLLIINKITYTRTTEHTHTQINQEIKV